MCRAQVAQQASNGLLLRPYFCGGLNLHIVSDTDTHSHTVFPAALRIQIFGHFIDHFEKAKYSECERQLFYYLTLHLCLFLLDSVVRNIDILIPFSIV